MQIYQLFPAITDAPEWKSSAFKGPVLVRAESEADARDLACERYWIASRAEGMPRHGVGKIWCRWTCLRSRATRGPAAL